jgi:hypothetical protein
MLYIGHLGPPPVLTAEGALESYMSAPSRSQVDDLCRYRLHDGARFILELLLKLSFPSHQVHIIFWPAEMIIFQDPDAPARVRLCPSMTSEPWTPWPPHG